MKKLILSTIFCLTAINICKAGDSEGSGTKSKKPETQIEMVCIKTAKGKYCYLRKSLN